MFRQIIVGLDGSEKSKKAARIGFDLARRDAGTVTLVHVPTSETAAFIAGTLSEYYAAVANPSFDEVERAGRKILNEAADIAVDVGFDAVETVMPYGEAAAEILLHADEIGADLIITGRRGLSRVSTFVLGSTTQRINHLAKCACLSVV